jgi:hypothetical protein
MICWQQNKKKPADMLSRLLPNLTNALKEPPFKELDYINQKL